MINGIGTALPYLPQSRRDQVDAAEQRNEVQRTQNTRDAERQAALERDPNAPEQSSIQADVRRTEALREVEANRFRRQREQEELPLESQQALQLYQSNQTSPEDDPRSQLVGVDLFV